jgi:hypothetical protein
MIYFLKYGLYKTKQKNKSNFSPLFQKHMSFVRDIFKAGNLVVSCVEYFQPMKFYPNSSFVFKHMVFLVFQDNEIILRYYLESTNFFELYYVLCSMSSNNMVHRQIKPFGSIKPKYVDLKLVIIGDLAHGMNRTPLTIKPINTSNNYI